jgi:putative membrane protein
MTLGELLPSVNASLNGLSAILLIAGKMAIRNKRVDVHRRLMVSAFVVSSVFLVCYLIRVALTGTHKYPGHGVWKAIYLVLLMSHMLFATATPILAIRSLWLAIKQRFADHKRLVRFTWPIWMYVSVTGVLVYLMLYHPPG